MRVSGLKYMILFMALMLCRACHTTTSVTQASRSSNAQVITVLKKGEFKIVFDQAFPLNTSGQNAVKSKPGSTSSSIYIGDGTNYLKINDKKVSGSLQYFGLRRSGYRSGRNGSIAFKDSLPDYDFQAFQGKKFHIDFKTVDRNHRDEHYQISLDIYKNGRSNMTVSSSQRSSISYRGQVEALENLSGEK